MEDETDQDFRTVADGFRVGLFGRHVHDDHPRPAGRRRGGEHQDGRFDERSAKHEKKIKISGPGLIKIFSA